MVTVITPPKPVPLAWVYELGLHDPARKGGEWVRFIRLRSTDEEGKPPTQAVFAQFLGVGMRTLAGWETGEFAISYATTKKIEVQELRLLALGRITLEESSFGKVLISKAIPKSIKERTLTALIDELTAMRERFREESWARSTSSV
jgi:transcriptional regulator with XRE-family HTH domain